MIRRTMSTTILNRPIIQLPTPHPSIQYVDFSAEERIIYRIVSIYSSSLLDIVCLWVPANITLDWEQIPIKLEFISQE